MVGGCRWWYVVVSGGRWWIVFVSFRYSLKFVFGVMVKMVKSWLNYSSRFPDGGPKKGNPTMMTSTVTARRKGDSQH